MAWRRSPVRIRYGPPKLIFAKIQGKSASWRRTAPILFMNYVGVIIEESLENKDILKDVKISGTKVEEVVEKHKTPWIKLWTLHTVEISENQVASVAEKISKALDSEHNWYADFKNDIHHYIIFRDKVFYIDRKSKEQYDEAKHYGISLGIPEYQVDFAPDDEIWER